MPADRPQSGTPPWQPSQLMFRRLLAQVVGELQQLPTLPPAVTETISYGHQYQMEYQVGTDTVSKQIQRILQTRFGHYTQLPVHQVSDGPGTQTEPILPESWPVPPVHSLTHPQRTAPAVAPTDTSVQDRSHQQLPARSGSADTGNRESGPGDAILYAVTSNSHSDVKDIRIAGNHDQPLAWYIELLHTARGAIYLHAFHTQRAGTAITEVFSSPISNSSPMIWLRIGRDTGSNHGATDSSSPSTFF